MIRRSAPLIASLAIMSLILAGCSSTATSTTTPTQPIDSLPDIDTEGFVRLIEGSDMPMVVNLWASWCVPCRSEAPLLAEAHRLLGSQVRFLGIATQDTRPDAQAFATEFSLGFENHFDSDAEVRSWIGSLGLPTTFFVAPGGEVISTIFGVIDERRLALEIDDLLAR